MFRALILSAKGIFPNTAPPLFLMILLCQLDQDSGNQFPTLPAPVIIVLTEEIKGILAGSGANRFFRSTSEPRLHWLRRFHRECSHGLQITSFFQALPGQIGFILHRWLPPNHIHPAPHIICNRGSPVFFLVAYLGPKG